MRAVTTTCAVLACALLASAGCSFDFTPDVTTQRPPVTEPAGKGRIFIAWTVGGKAPDAAGCGLVDHLSLKLEYHHNSVKVEPIPCALDRFRYDRLPTGDADAVLTGFDSAGCVITSGTAPLTISTDLPATPSPTVAIDAPHACR